jgi:uncharacterized protein YlxW (UPF0749 family)
MKKLVLATIMFALLTAGAYAQDTKPQAKKPATTEELQWQAQALQNEYLYLQERLKNLQVEYNKVKSELDSHKAPVVDTSKPEDKKKK